MTKIMTRILSKRAVPSSRQVTHSTRARGFDEGQGETVGIVFSISNPGPMVIAKGTVIWDDKHGQSGLHLSFASSVDKDRIAEWLDSEMFMQSNIDETQ
jgi:hypothetical protein